MINIKTIALLLCVTLTGCASGNMKSIYQAERVETVAVPQNLYKCYKPKKPKNIDQLKDSDAANFINRQNAAINTCAASLRNIKSYNDQASGQLPPVH